MYGFGQIFTGIIGDRVSPFKMIVSGMALSALCNIIMTFQPSGSIAAMCVIWGVNGAAQSAVWAPAVRIFAQILSPERRFKAIMNINITVPAGTLATYLLSAVLLRYFTWKSVFYSGGVIVAAGAALLLVYYILNKKYFITENITGKAEQNGPGSHKNHKTVFAVLLIAAFPVIIHGMLKDSIVAWFPVYLNESHGVASYTAVMLTTFLPIVNLSGIYAAKFVYGKIKSNEFTVCGIMFAVCAAGFGLMFCLGGYNLYFAAILAAAGTASMFGVNVMLISALPVRFGKIGAASTVTGTLNAATYIGAAVSMIGSGNLVDKFGWQVTTGVWCILAVSGVILCLLLRKIWDIKKDNI